MNSNLKRTAKSLIPQLVRIITISVVVLHFANNSLFAQSEARIGVAVKVVRPMVLDEAAYYKNFTYVNTSRIHFNLDEGTVVRVESRPPTQLPEGTVATVPRRRVTVSYQNTGS